MATVTKPIALDESINTTEPNPRNIADVLADELSSIAQAISGGGGGGSKAEQSIVAPVLSSFVATGSIKTAGQQFIYGGVLYEITTTVTSGTSFVVGSNVKVADSVTEQIVAMKLIHEQKTVTTSTSGNANLSINPSTYVITSIYCSSSSHYVAIPFRASANAWGVHVIDDVNSVVASTSVTLEVYYVAK